jgi:hypothetical protein
VNFGLWDVAARKKIAELGPLIPAGPMPARPRYMDLLGYHEERARVRLVSLKTRDVVSEFPLPASLRNYRWSAGGRFLAADFYDKPGIHVADGQTGTWYPVDGSGEGMVESVADERPLLAVASEIELGQRWLRWLIKEPPRRQVIRIIDILTGRVLDEVPGVTSLLSPDGKILAVQTRAGPLELWDLPLSTPWQRILGTGLVVWGVILLGQTAWARRSRTLGQKAPRTPSQIPNSNSEIPNKFQPPKSQT